MSRIRWAWIWTTASIRSIRPRPTSVSPYRGYIDFERLYVFTLSSAFFVVRTKENVVLQRRYFRPVEKSVGLRSDHTVVLTAIASVKACRGALRRVNYSESVGRRCAVYGRLPSCARDAERAGDEDPDQRIAAKLLTGGDCALTALQRYASATERSYYKSHTELLRSRQMRNEAKFYTAPGENLALRL
jgi:hypothetical protein